VSTLFPGATVVEQRLKSTSNMASKRARPKDTVERSIRDVVEHVSMNLPVYVDTQLFIEKDMKLTCQGIKDIFSCSFKEDLEDR